MADKVTNYKCPACTGPLHFAGASGKLECEYCGSNYTVEEVEAMYAAADAKAEEAMAAGNDEWEQMAQEWSGGEGITVYKCPSCTAELVYDDTTAASSCPYCGNPTVVPGQFSGMLKPDFVIPFKHEKNAAVEALKKHYGGKFLLPKEFKDQNHIEEVKGVYVPFWLYDGEAFGDVTFEATKSTKTKSGDTETTITKHYQVERSGGLSFEKIPADASTKMPDDMMDSIEPYKYEDLKPFSTAYLAGYMADKYDVSAEENAARAVARAKGSTLAALREDVKGYDTVSEKLSNINVKQGKISYALMPVWMLNTKWNGQNYMFAMNGQTGKLVGDLPEDKKKATITFILIYIACIIANMVILDLGFVMSLLFGLIIPFIVLAVLKGALKSVATATTANVYVDKSSVKITHRVDTFTHETKDVRKISSNNS